MRIVFTGVSHWHLPLYLDPVLEMLREMPELTIAGVEDPSLQVAQSVAARIGCDAWDDWRSMIETVRPDFVFVLGRHCDMEAVGRFLIANDIPCCIEKPCGLNLAEVSALATLMNEKNAFVAVPFVFRQSRMYETLLQAAASPSHLSFKFIAGSVDRYRQAGCDWMLRRAESGGGSTINLGVHFLDLAVLLLGSDVTVSSGLMSTITTGQDTEDYGIVVLQNQNGSCLIETGYLYPAPHMTFDMHFSMRTPEHYFAGKDASGLAILDQQQNLRFEDMPMTNPPYYPHFVRDVIARAQRRDRPVADLNDMAAVMRLVEDAYGLAPLTAKPDAVRTKILVK